MIRPARVADLTDINVIYNQAVAHGFQTADNEPIDMATRIVWFEDHSVPSYPVFVYEDNGHISGWASLSKYRKGRKVLNSAAEISYYIRTSDQQQGIGSQLMEFTISEAITLEYKTLIAILLDTNNPSIQLLKKFGFQEWGRIPKVASIQGAEYDHLYYGLRIIP